MNTSIFTPELIAIISMFVTLGGGMLVFGISFTNRLSRVETRLDGVDRRLDEKFDVIDKKFEKIEEQISDLGVQINDVRTDVAFLKGNFAAQGASPLELTQRGMQIAKSIDGSKVIEDNFEMFAAYIKENTPTGSLFDILVTGRQVIKANINDILSEEQKDKLYAIGADRYLVLDTLSILLRDKYVSAAVAAA